MEENEKKFRIRFYHIFFSVIGIALMWICICYAWRGVYYVGEELLFKWGKGRYVGKYTEIQMEQKKDAFYFTIKDKESGEQKEAVLRWTRDVSDIYKEYEITFGKDYVKKGKWTEDLEISYYTDSGCWGQPERHEDVMGNTCRALCRIAAKKYEHLGSLGYGLLGVVLFLIGAWCCIPYEDVLFVQWGLPKRCYDKNIRVLELMFGIFFIIFGIGMTSMEGLDYLLYCLARELGCY